MLMNVDMSPCEADGLVGELSDEVDVKSITEFVLDVLRVDFGRVVPTDFDGEGADVEEAFDWEGADVEGALVVLKFFTEGE